MSTSNSRSGLAALLCLVLSLGVGAAGASTVVVKAGTKVPLELRAPLSTKTAAVGQKVPLFTKTALVVGGVTVVPSGTEVQGTISKVVKRSGFGKNARVYVALSNLPGPKGVRIPLDTLKTPRKFKGDTGGAATGAGVLVLGPVGAVGGILVKGSDMVFQPGRPFQAEVVSDTPVNL